MSAEQFLDPRILRTKVAIQAALIGLIEEKGFEALSVKDLTTRAGINRGTFYLHYQDKYDLLEQIENEIIADIESIVQRVGPVDAAELKDFDGPLPFIIALFEYLYQHSALMRAFFSLKGDVAFQNRIRKVIERNLEKLGFLNHVRMENLLVPSEYLVSYIFSAHMGVVQSWLKKGCRESPYEMALILSQLSIKGPLHATGLD